MKIFHLKKISILIIVILFSLFNGVSNGYGETDEGKIIYYTLLKGTINKKLATDFEAVLKEAESTKAKALILEIDTFGGRLDAAVKIKDNLIDTQINTIAFINKKAISTAALIWFLLGLVLIFLEFIVPGVILIFFGIGAWFAAVTTYFGLTVSLESQLLAFAITSIVLLVVLRKWIKGKFYGHVSDVQDLTQNLDEFTGKNVVVLKDVIPGKMEGMVEFKGATWRAVSDEHIKNGEVAIITDVDGITLNIRRKKEG